MILVNKKLNIKSRTKKSVGHSGGKVLGFHNKKVVIKVVRLPVIINIDEDYRAKVSPFVCLRVSTGLVKNKNTPSLSNSNLLTQGWLQCNAEVDCRKQMKMMRSELNVNCMSRVWCKNSIRVGENRI